MNPVLEFLQKHPDYSFDEGVAVLLRYSANRGVNTFIMSRRDRMHLRNELNRLAHIPNLRPLPGMEEPKSNENEPKSNENEPKSDENEPKSDENSQKVETTAADDDDTVTYLDLKRHEQYDPDKLPPTLKELWLKNRDEYKELQYCHAQMKQANSDAGRADWRKQVFEHRESLQERWKLFDEEKARLEAEAKTDTTEETAYNPLNDRAYISKAMKQADWDDARKLEVQHRVDALLKHNIPISDETVQRLKDRGINIE
jgi:hypothetical protein